MPRIRTLKPEHRQHRKVGRLTDRQYRLWVGMLLEADDEGRLVADVAQLRLLIFGYQPHITVSQVSQALAAVASVGLVELYENAGSPYAWFPDWKHHQRIDRPQRSNLPSIKDSTSTRRTFVEHSSIVRRGSEGSEGKKEGSRSSRKREAPRDSTDSRTISHEIDSEDSDGSRVATQPIPRVAVNPTRTDGPGPASKIAHAIGNGSGKAPGGLPSALVAKLHAAHPEKTPAQIMALFAGQR